MFFQFTAAFGLIALVTVGLAIIFGMMGVINLAHGEFIVVGVYGTALTYHAGVPLAAAMLVGVLVTVVFGVIVEFTVVQHLYDRLLDSMVATWGLALVIAQGLSIRFGPSLDSITTPLQWVNVGPYTIVPEGGIAIGPVTILSGGVGIPHVVQDGAIVYGQYSSGFYRSAVLPVAALLVLAGLYVLFTRTEFGVRARATIEDPETARAMGVDTDRMYRVTFGIGAGLAGVCGALFAPLGSIGPNMGTQYMVDAFVAVVVGGPSVIVGTLSASTALSAVSTPFNFAYGTFVAQIALLLVAMLALRVLPDGITGYVDDWRRRRRADS